MNFKIILQARANSTRLPGKMLKPFFEDSSIPEIIINNLKRHFRSDHMILATTNHVNDNGLEELGKRHGIGVFRGDEQDVLKRFIDAAESFKADVVVRVCADNPFLQADSIVSLLQWFEEHRVDYLSYQLEDETPVIKSHLGLFAEVTTLEALRKASKATSEKFYHEHVTNYIYEHSDMFKVKFIDLPKYLGIRKEIRLTIDTAEDFELCQEIYREIEPNCSTENILNALDLNPSRIARMNAQIIQNSK